MQRAFANLKYAGMAVAIGLCLPSMAAAPVATQVWNNTQIFNGAVSSVVLPTTTDTFYTVFVKTVSPPASGQSMSISLQTSPDGVNWATAGTSSASISPTFPSGWTIQFSVDTLAPKVRLVTSATAGASATVTAWIVH